MPHDTSHDMRDEEKTKGHVAPRKPLKMFVKKTFHIRKTRNEIQEKPGDDAEEEIISFVSITGDIEEE